MIKAVYLVPHRNVYWEVGLAEKEIPSSDRPHHLPFCPCLVIVAHPEVFHLASKDHVGGTNGQRYVSRVVVINVGYFTSE
jgi:hypothetical protein